MPGYRSSATFVADWRLHARPLDRNARAKILVLAESLERKSKPPGKRNGLLGYVGLTVLRTLLLGFLNPSTGLCCPSYDTLSTRTGLCRQSIANGIARLERAGIVRIVRRLVRQRVRRQSPITGEPEEYTGTTQTSSLYAFDRPPAYAEHLTLPVGRNAPFPARRQIELLEHMQLLWVGKLSTSYRVKPLSPTQQLSDLLAMGRD